MPIGSSPPPLLLYLLPYPPKCKGRSVLASEISLFSRPIPSLNLPLVMCPPLPLPCPLSFSSLPIHRVRCFSVTRVLEDRACSHTLPSSSWLISHRAPLPSSRSVPPFSVSACAPVSLPLPRLSDSRCVPTALVQGSRSTVSSAATKSKDKPVTPQTPCTTQAPQLKNG